MSDVQWLIFMAVCLMLAAAALAFGYAYMSAQNAKSMPEILERLKLIDAKLSRVELIEERYKKLQEGMRRAHTWKSEYEIESPPPEKPKLYG